MPDSPPTAVVRIGFDVGGVLSKYPATLKPLLGALHFCPGVEVWIISDMHPEQKIIDMLELNEVWFYKHRVRSADYRAHGEASKAILCEQLHIDVLIDDFIGYVGVPGTPPVRLLVMPDASQPYYADDWKTDGSEGDFGRRKKLEFRHD